MIDTTKIKRKTLRVEIDQPEVANDSKNRHFLTQFSAPSISKSSNEL